jgi:hypothetical protein
MIKADSNCDICGKSSKYTGELTNNQQYNVGARWNVGICVVIYGETVAALVKR